MKRYMWLDPLRWFLASFVFLFHAVFAAPKLITWPWVDQILQLGFLGVDAFFVISGFAIGMSVIGITPLHFLANRAKRLIPSLVIVGILTTCLAVIANLFGSGEKESWNSILRDFGLGMIPFPRQDGSFVNFVAWTILVECQFYFLVLITIIIYTSNKKKFSVDGLLYLSLIWSFGVYMSKFLVLPDLYKILAGDFAGYFIFGIIISLLVQKNQPVKLKSGTFAQLLITIPLLVNSFEKRLETVSLQNKNLGVMVLFSLILSVILAIAIPNTKSKKFNSIVTEIGKASYPLYLILGNFAMIIFVFLAEKIPLLPAMTVAYIISGIIAISISTKFEKQITNRFLKYLST